MSAGTGFQKADVERVTDAVILDESWNRRGKRCDEDEEQEVHDDQEEQEREQEEERIFQCSDKAARRETYEEDKVRSGRRRTRAGSNDGADGRRQH